MLCLNKNPVHFLFNFRFLVLAFGHSFIWVKVELIMIDVRNTNLSDLSWSLEVELKEGTDSDTQLDSAKWIHVVLKDLDFLEEINQKDFEDISRATLVDQTKQQRKDFPLLPEMIFEPWSFIKMTSH